MHFTRNPEGDFDHPPAMFGLDLAGSDILELIERRLELDGTDWFQLNAADRLASEVAWTFWDDDLYVTMYDVDQGYGGPEEGGWYFEVLTLEDAWKIDADNWEDRLAQIKTAYEIYVEYYKKLDWGTYGTFGGWKHHSVRIEVVKQGEQPGVYNTTHKPAYC